MDNSNYQESPELVSIGFEYNQQSDSYIYQTNAVHARVSYTKKAFTIYIKADDIFYDLSEYIETSGEDPEVLHYSEFTGAAFEALSIDDVKNAIIAYVRKADQFIDCIKCRPYIFRSVQPTRTRMYG